MKKIICLSALALIGSGMCISVNAQVFNPGGSSGIGVSTTNGVGIGISAPRAMLDVHWNCVQGGLATLLVTGNSGFQTCLFGSNMGETFRVRTETSNGVFRDDFVVKASSGRIGIGTVNPKNKLHIQDGSIRFTGTDPALGSENIIWGGTSSAPDGEWAVEYNMNLFGYAGLNFWRPNQSSDGNGNPQLTTNAVLFLGNNNHVGVNTNNPIANLTVNGNMLIGDPAVININTPFRYGLYVQHGILTERLKVAASTDAVNWSDYVFAPDYKLLPVDSVADFIHQNGHLPNVPSSNDVSCDGIDVAQMDAVLLRQIEELWLHVIDLENTNQGLRKELEQQKH